MRASSTRSGAAGGESVVADRDDLRLDLAVDRREHARLGDAAAGGVGPGARGGELLA